MSDHTDIVAAVKADLLSRGEIGPGPCGAFAITLRVAFRLRGDDWQLLKAPPGGENCGGFRADKLVSVRDGRFVDCLVDAGGANTPAWDERAATHDELAMAGGLVNVDPDGALPAPAPPPAPPPPFDLQAFAAELFNELEQIARRVADLTTAVQALTTKLDTVNQQGVRVHF